MTIVERHETLFSNKLNQLWFQGYCTIERWEILSWFGSDEKNREKITDAVWREIVMRWNEYTGEKKLENTPQIQVIRCDTATPTQSFVLIQSSRLNDLPLMAE